MDEQHGYTFDEYWDSIVAEAAKAGGSDYSRLLYKQLIHCLRTGEAGALSSPSVRAFLADGLDDALSVKNPGEAGKAMSINGPTRRKGTGDHQHTERLFIDWYCKQCEDVTPTHAEIRHWKIQNADSVSDRTFGSWKAKARQEFDSPKSVYQMFKDLG